MIQRVVNRDRKACAHKTKCLDVRREREWPRPGPAREARRQVGGRKRNGWRGPMSDVTRENVGLVTPRLLRGDPHSPRENAVRRRGQRPQKRILDR
jgi:hypothetical protein